MLLLIVQGLRTVPTFVTAHLEVLGFPYGWYLLIQGYFCAV